MREIVEEEVADIFRVEAAGPWCSLFGHAGLHGLAERLRHLPHGGDLIGGERWQGQAAGKVGQHRSARVGRRLDCEAIFDFSESDVEAWPGGRAAAHRMTEAGGCRPAAVHGHDEQFLATGLVADVDRLASHENAILDGQRCEVTAADADHRELLRLVGGRGLLPAVGRAAPGLNRLPRGKQKILERMRADDMVKRAGLWIVMKPVDAAILLVEPAGWEKLRLCKITVDDRAVGHLWAHHAVTATAKHVDQVLER